MTSRHVLHAFYKIRKKHETDIIESGYKTGRVIKNERIPGVFQRDHFLQFFADARLWKVVSININY